MQVPALTILMSLLRTTSEHLTALQNPVAYTFDLAMWRKITHGLLAADVPVQAEVLAEFATRYLNQYDDIRFYFLRTVKSVNVLLMATKLSDTIHVQADCGEREGQCAPQEWLHAAFRVYHYDAIAGR